MPKSVVRKYRAFAAVVAGLVGLGAGGAPLGNAAGGCDPAAPDCGGGGSEAQGQHVEFFADQLTREDVPQPPGQRELFFVGPLFTLTNTVTLTPPTPARSRVAEGKLFVQTAVGPQTFAIGKVFEAPAGTGHRFLFEGHLIPASADATQSDLEQSFEFEGRLLPTPQQ